MIYNLTFEVPKRCFEIEHQFKASEWAPGIWAGCEGLKLTVTQIDFEKRTVKLEYIKEPDEKTTKL